MKKIWIIWLFVIVIVISGCTYPQTTTPKVTETQPVTTTAIPQTTSQTAPTAAINIKNYAFDPSTITIAKGTTVTWTNSDSVPHTITSDSFDSGSISPGGTFSHGFNQPGTFVYRCTIHTTMSPGTIIVT